MRLRSISLLFLFGGLCFGAGYFWRQGWKAVLVRIYLRNAPVTWTAGVPKPDRVMKGDDAAPPPIARFEPAVAVVAGRVYVLGGFFNGQLHASARCDVFDPNANTWSRLADMPVAVTHAGVAVARGDIWVAGGFAGNNPGSVTAAVWRYDTAANRWSPQAMLPEARGAGGLAFVKGELHFVGGLKADRQSDADEHWSLALEPDAEWRLRAPLPVARNHFSTVAVQDSIHVLGGQHGHDTSFIDVDDHHVYDAGSDSWREAARLRLPRSHTEPGSFHAQGQIVLMGGRSNRIPVLFDVDGYEIATGKWRLLGGLPHPHRAPVGRIVGESLFAGMGGINVHGIDPSAEWRRYPVSELRLAASGGESSR